MLLQVVSHLVKTHHSVNLFVKVFVAWVRSPTGALHDAMARRGAWKKMIERCKKQDKDDSSRLMGAQMQQQTLFKASIRDYFAAS